MDVASFIAGAIWGALIFWWLLSKKFEKIQRKHPYRYACPEAGCAFSCSSNKDAQTILRMADAHVQSHRKEV